MSEKLTQAISTLNDAQRQAVEQVFGPVLVLAGPGTGKTHLLTLRVANILASDAGADASNILCLTFTENAAVEMRTRLQKWLGPEAYKIKIATFHGFCQWVLDDNPQLFAQTLGEKELADDLQKALAYRAVIKAKRWHHFSSVWDDFAHQRNFLSAVSNLKREGVNPTTLRAMIPAEQERLEGDPKNFYQKKFKAFNPGDWKPQAKAKIKQKVEQLHELAELWERYEDELQKRGLRDFDDLINTVVHALKNDEALRLDLQERFQWVLVDEYQDTNNAQNAILWHLSEGVEQPNVFAVGDDDQSIYRFQGASVANITEFRAKFPERLEVTLTQNYRSHQHILDAAYHSVAHNLERANADKQLKAKQSKFLAEPPGQIVQAELSSRLAEISFLADTIQAQLKAGVVATDIAVLVRKNREIEELARELPKFNIPVAAQIAHNVFENEAVRQLILMLQLFADPGQDDLLFDLLHADFLQLDPHVLLNLSLERKRGTVLAQQLLQTKDENLSQWWQFFTTAGRDYHHLRAAVVAEKLLYESGLAEFMTAQNRLADWQAVRKFLGWIREQAGTPNFRREYKFNQELKAILERVELHRDLDIALYPDPLPADKHSIQIMTAHKSKGLEFSVVLIPGLEDKAWGNPRAKAGIHLPQLKPSEAVDENEEERRLFFVALTRAKAQLYLSYSQTDFSGRDKAPSQFWHELPENLVTQIETDELEAKLQSLLPVFFNQAEKTLTDKERALLQERVAHFRWSASSLQTYLDCPRKFLYQYLYRFPRRPLPQLALGVALHQALERVFTLMRQETAVPLETLLSEYESALRGQNLPASEYEKFLPHGQEILTSYHQQKLQNFAADYPHGFELEYDFDRFNPQLGEINLTGKMDKVVYLDEKKSRAKIVDYKSGRPKAIKPGESYWRQLVFYELLARQSSGVGWQVESGEIEFLTPDQNDKLDSRSLEITATDREQVITELKETHTKVMNLEFPLVPNPTGDKEVDYWQNFGT